MNSWMQDLDEIGPEKIVHVHDPATGMRGVVVVDSTALSGITAGGLRMLPDITTGEIRLLARAMTYKYCALDLPVGGVKSGIWADPSTAGRERSALMKAFGRAVKPLLASGVMVGADIGTDMHDVAAIYEGAGLPYDFSGLSVQLKDDEPLENHATGYGVVVAARAACEFAGFDLAGARVAVEGFGKAGGGVARYLDEAGAHVVAISTVSGTAYQPEGLDVPNLLEARKTSGDAAVQACSSAEQLPREALFGLPVDLLVPGARPYVIDESNVSQVQAKVIASIANVPITDPADGILHHRGVHVVPDFISNAGGVLIGAIDLLGGSADLLFRILDEQIGRATRENLEAASQAGQSPRSVAIRQAREKILAARSNPDPPSLQEIMEAGRRRLGI